MTRLSSDLVAKIPHTLKAYDQELVHKTGKTLNQLACRAAGLGEHNVERLTSQNTAAVVPVTAGKGLIPGFSLAVQSIVNHVGFSCFTTSQTDVSGLAEAVKKRAQVVFMADDCQFIAMNLPSGIIVENSEATAKGYVAALEALAGDLKNKKILLIGAGNVGSKACSVLHELGAQVTIHDKNKKKAEILAEKTASLVEKDLSSALGCHVLILEATPAAGIIKPGYITPETRIAACGLPLALTAQAQRLAEDHLVHDPLQIGVATMAFMAAIGIKKKKGGG